MYIGIDLGGTKTEVICLDEQGCERYRHRTASPQNSYSGTISLIKQLVTQSENEMLQKGSVGIGIPGSISLVNHTVRNANSAWLNGRAFQQDIELALERSVLIENDANCFVLSEAFDGAAQEADVVFGAILGTGCGGGIVVQNRLVSGVNGLAGEWGHNSLPFPKVYLSGDQSECAHYFDAFEKVEQSSIYNHKEDISYFSENITDSEYPGPLCYCGKRGCLETWISGRGLSRDFQRSTGYSQSAELIVEQAEKGQQSAVLCLERYYERLAKSFAQMINTIDPDVIVCGGGLSNVDTIYSEIPKRWDKYIFSDQFSTRLARAHHGDSSGVRGAALLWRE